MSESQQKIIVTAKKEIHIPRNPHKPTYEELNPRSKPTEFLGPAGALAVSILCPLFSYLLFFGCNEYNGCPPSPSYAWFDFTQRELKNLARRLVDPAAILVYLGWYAYTVACWYLLPGDWVEGTLLRNGHRQVYKINAFSTLLLTLGLSAGLLFTDSGLEALSWLYDHWLGLLTGSLIMSIAQAAWVYAYSFQSGELLALGGNSGVFVYDFFIGRPLNPTPPNFPSFDIKSFNELRPGLILWLILDIACLAELAVTQGGLDKVSWSMWLVLAGQGVYVVDALYNETSILTTMDITTDGFGFMLSIGDLTWVPFTYTLQARYLAFSKVDVGPVASVVIAAVMATGYYIFRVSNGDKNNFRNGRNPKKLEYMSTASGSKLITSGWWGRSRHPNYLGDLLMGLAWCLPTGFNTPITYFYIIYFLILLVHRQIRDDEACHKKYGKDWEAYCEKVPNRIMPYVY